MLPAPYLLLGVKMMNSHQLIDLPVVLVQKHVSHGDFDFGLSTGLST